MPDNDNGVTPGADAGAENEGGKGGNGNADQKPGNESKKGGKGDDAGADEPAGLVTFKSQADLDAVIKRRVDRALKDEKAKAELSETDRLKKDAEDARAEVKERDLRDDFVAKSGLTVSAGQRLFKMFRDDLDVDDNGKATNLDAVLKDAKKEFPTLFGKAGVIDAGKGDGAAGNDKAAGGDMNSALRRMAGRS